MISGWLFCCGADAATCKEGDVVQCAPLPSSEYEEVLKEMSIHDGELSTLPSTPSCPRLSDVVNLKDGAGFSDGFGESEEPPPDEWTDYDQAVVDNCVPVDGSRTTTWGTDEVCTYSQQSFDESECRTPTSAGEAKRRLRTFENERCNLGHIDERLVRLLAEQLDSKSGKPRSRPDNCAPSCEKTACTRSKIGAVFHRRSAQ